MQTINQLLEKIAEQLECKISIIDNGTNPMDAKYLFGMVVDLKETILDEDVKRIAKYKAEIFK